MTVIIRPGEALLDDWRAIWRGEALAVDPSSRAVVAASAAAVERIDRKSTRLNSSHRP